MDRKEDENGSNHASLGTSLTRRPRRRTFDPGMKMDSITEVTIDEQGRLLIYPTANRYPMIYREAVEVNWDPGETRVRP